MTISKAKEKIRPESRPSQRLLAITSVSRLVLLNARRALVRSECKEKEVAEVRAETVKIETVTRTVETVTVVVAGKWIFRVAKTEKEKSAHE